MMTLDETMIINNMTNVIKNLEQSKRICDIIDDLNKRILTLGGRKRDEPEHVQVEHVSVKAVTVTHVHTETKDKTGTHVHTETNGPLSESPRSVAAPRAAAGPPSESKPVQKQEKAKSRRP